MKLIVVLLTSLFFVTHGFTQAPEKSFTEKLDGISTSSQELTKGASSDNSSIGQSGNLNTQIELVQVISRTMTFPIELHYSSGIKVDQKSGPVGLGWTMPFGSIKRDYGAFEPDYTSKQGELMMHNSNGNSQLHGWLNPDAIPIDPGTHNEVLGYNTISGVGTGADAMTLSDHYHVSVPGFLSNSFWNGAGIDENHEWQWSTYENWKVEATEKTFSIDQEFSRINENNINVTPSFDINSSYAHAIGVLPYVHNGSAFAPTSNNPVGNEYRVTYDDFGSFIVTDDHGTQYVFGRALRGQKYVFDDNPFWSVHENPGPYNAANGNFWKIDFVSEWLLTEIRSVDYQDLNGNGIADDEDAGDWIRFEYTAATKTEYTVPFGAGQGGKAAIVPTYREWSSFSQTDRASSLMFERAYLEKIVTPTQIVDLTISQRYDVDHDYHNKPANRLNNSYYFEDLNYGTGGSDEDFDIHYPIETMKYDSIKVKSRLMDDRLYSENLTTGLVVLNYAQKGSADELAVSEYLIRNNDDTPKVDNTTGGILGSPSNGAMDIEKFKSTTEKRGKTTLLGVDFLDGDQAPDSRTSYSFEYSYNPSYNEIHKRQIVKSWAMPSLRQASRNVNDQNIKKHPPISNYVEERINSLGQPSTSVTHSSVDPVDFLITSPYEEKWHHYNHSQLNTSELNAFVDSGTDPIADLTSTSIPQLLEPVKDVYGYFGNGNCTGCAEAWSLTKITYPTGGTVSFEYEEGTYDVSNNETNWSLTTNNFPVISQYNDLAKNMSIGQDLYTEFSKQLGTLTPDKQLTATFEVLLSNNYGIRLKTKTVNDRVNPVVVTNYEYGDGHFTELPTDFVQNYISTFNSFLIREDLRHEWELDHYASTQPIWTPGYDNFYKGKMSYTALSNISLDNYHSTFFYDYIDSKYANNSYQRANYDLFTDGGSLSYPIHELFCIKNPIDVKKREFVIAGNAALSSPVVLSSVEYFETGSQTAYKTETYTYDFDIVDSREVLLDYVSPLSTTLEMYDNIYEYWLPVDQNVNPQDYFNYFGLGQGIELGPFNPSIHFPSNWVTAQTQTPQGHAFGFDKNQSYSKNYFLVTNGGIYKKYSTIKMLTTKREVNYKGLISSTSYVYDPATFVLREEIVEGSTTTNKYIKRFEYAHETYSGQTNLFENKNQKKLPSRTTSYLNQVIDANAISASMITYDHNNFSNARPENSYNYEVQQLNSNGTFTLQPFVLGGANQNWRKAEMDASEYNRTQDLVSYRDKRLFGKEITGNGLNSMKANFKYPQHEFDATYTGFDDLVGLHKIEDWTTQSYLDETWFAQENENTEETAVSVHSMYNPCNVQLNGECPDVTKLYNVVTIDNVSNLSEGDQVSLELFGSANAVPNGTAYYWNIETTISEIIPVSSFPGSPSQALDYYVCFSDPIVYPSSSVINYFCGANRPDETAFYTIDDTKLTNINARYDLSKTYARTGQYSYQLPSQRVEEAPFKKTPIRPVKVKYQLAGTECGSSSAPVGGVSGRSSSELDPSCFWDYKASVWLKHDTDAAPQVPTGEPVPNQTLDPEGDNIYRRGTVTTVNNASGFKIVCDIWNFDRTTLIEQLVYYPENMNTAWQQFTVDIPVKKGSIKYIDVYVQNERDQVGVINQAQLKSLFVDDLLVYPSDARYSYKVLDKFGNPTYAVNNNDVFIESKYDSKGRLLSVHNAYGSTTQEMMYYDTPNWSNETNHVTQRDWVDNGSYSETRSYIDGFGKTKQVQIADIDRDFRTVGETVTYDNLGRISRSYKAYALSGSAFEADFNNEFDLKTQNLYGSYHAFTSAFYESKPEEILTSMNLPRTNLEQTVQASQSDYVSTLQITNPYSSVVYNSGELLIHETTDAEGAKTRTYMDDLGRVILEEQEIGNDHIQNTDGSISDTGTGFEIAQTWFVYDASGHLIKIVDPDGKTSEYFYNSLGMLVKSDVVDKGVTEMRYDKYGQVRFSRNAIDISATNTNIYNTDQFSYVKYDVWGRITESGVIVAANTDPASHSTPYTGQLYFDDYSKINDQDFPAQYAPQNQVYIENIYDYDREHYADDALLESRIHSNHVFMTADGSWISGKTDFTKYQYMADGQLSRYGYLYDGLANYHYFEPQYNGLHIPIGSKYDHPTTSSFDFEWTNTLDGFGRISKTSTTQNSSVTDHGEYFYDILGNLVVKGIGGTGNPSDPYLDYQAVKLNIRDQAVHSVSNHFRFGLKRDKNGRITDQYWSNSEFDDLTNNQQVNLYAYTHDKKSRLTGANYSSQLMANGTFDYFNGISLNLPDNFYCGVNAAAFRTTTSPILNELRTNIRNRYKSDLSAEAIDNLNILDVEYISNDVQYQDMTSTEQDAFLDSYISAIDAADGNTWAYEQYQAEENNDQNHLDLISQGPPAGKDLKYTKLLLMSVPYDPEVVFCDPNPSATVYGYLNDFPFPGSVTTSNKYDVAYWYSNNGNLEQLNRNDDSGDKMEQSYTYSNTASNELSTVQWTDYSGTPTSFSHNYTYDAMGNLKTDPRNSVTDLSYNKFHIRVESITQSGSTSNYRYDVNQQRTAKEISTTNKQYYMDGVVLDMDGDVISYQTPEGFAEPLGPNVTYSYYLRDWQGTNRGVINASGVVVNAQDHYPFGMTMPSRNLVTANDGKRYQFTGHEYDEETGYGYHGARYYNRELGRYMSPDRYSEEFYDQSTYVYAGNMAVDAIDVNGDSTLFYNEDGDLIGYSHDDMDNQIVIVSDSHLESFKESYNSIRNGDLVGKDVKEEDRERLIENQIGLIRFIPWHTRYDYDAFTQFYDDWGKMKELSDGSIVPTDPDLMYGDDEQEWGQYLVKSGMNLVTLHDSEPISGTSINLFWPGMEGAVGDLHTHPEFAKSTPSSMDWDRAETIWNGNYSVMVDAAYVVFYAYHGNNISAVYIDRKNPFKKAKEKLNNK